MIFSDLEVSSNPFWYRIDVKPYQSGLKSEWEKRTWKSWV